MRLIAYDHDDSKGFVGTGVKTIQPNLTVDEIVTEIAQGTSGEPYVVLFHGSVIDALHSCTMPASAQVAGNIEKWLEINRTQAPIWRPNLAGIAVLRNQVFAGIQRTQAEELARVSAGRIHIVSYAVDTALAGSKFGQRLRTFAEHVAGLPVRSLPNWELLEPSRWPENLVAVYLLLLASTRNSDAGFSAEMTRLLQTTICSEAAKEFAEIGGENWHDPRTSPEACLDVTRKKFEEIAAKA